MSQWICCRIFCHAANNRNIPDSTCWYCTHVWCPDCLIESIETPHHRPNAVQPTYDFSALGSNPQHVVSVPQIQQPTPKQSNPREAVEEFLKREDQVEGKKKPKEPQFRAAIAAIRKYKDQIEGKKK